MEKSKSKITVYCALGTTLLVLCSWTCLPMVVPFTMQTFAVAFLSAILGVKKGLFAIITYILLGFIGLPVFSGFRAGPPAIFSATGGYTLGFIPFCIVTGILCKKSSKSYPMIFASMSAGLLLCYISGTLWYSFIYLKGLKGLWSAASVCVFPFIIPDIIKISLAALLASKYQRFIK